ncbi:MAG: hypothetical protein GY839_08040 [candidate division Zixibacteria bacterium]|nr:hypothetical protein [candidate division Zixibacteria bacterium]
MSNKNKSFWGWQTSSSAANFMTYLLTKGQMGTSTAHFGTFPQIFNKP